MESQLGWLVHEVIENGMATTIIFCNTLKDIAIVLNICCCSNWVKMPLIFLEPSIQ